MEPIDEGKMNSEPVGFDSRPLSERSQAGEIKRKEILKALGELEKADQRLPQDAGWYGCSMISQHLKKRVTHAKMRWLLTEGYVDKDGYGGYCLSDLGRGCVDGREKYPGES